MLTIWPIAWTYLCFICALKHVHCRQMCVPSMCRCVWAIRHFAFEGAANLYLCSRRQRDRRGRTQPRTRHFHKINSQFFHSNRFLCIKLFYLERLRDRVLSFFSFLVLPFGALQRDADRRSISPCLCECAHGREGEGESEWNLIIWPSLNPYTLARHKFFRIYFYFNSAVLFGRRLVSFCLFANSSQFVGTAAHVSTRDKISASWCWMAARSD